MNDWIEEKINDICEIIGGGTPKTTVPEYWDGEIPWLSVVDFNSDNRHVSNTDKTITLQGLNNSSTKMLNVGDIIISARGTVGALAQLSVPMAFNQSCYGIRAKKNTTNDFLYYSLKNKIVEIKTKTHGSVFDTITRDTFDILSIYLPPLPEQRAIADTLSCLDDMIELNNRTNKVLEEMAQAIFKRWFIDFEFPDENGNPYKSSGGAMEESELGEIPVGWRVGNLLEIAEYLNGLPMQKFRPKENEKGYPVLKIKELRQGMADNNSEMCSKNINKNYIINDGDLIFSWSGSLLLDFWCGGKCGLNQHLFKVTSNKYSKWFYYFWTYYHLEKFIGIAKDKATTMGHILRGDLEKSNVLIMDNLNYEKFDLICNPIIETIISNRVANRKLATIRDSLLPKLMSGEIRVPVEEG